ncbi:MAG: serine hydrolase [Weeksellaceae bacterium]|nr:serine hydrolase [Weeksellaceae bacterium]
MNFILVLRQWMSLLALGALVFVHAQLNTAVIDSLLVRTTDAFDVPGMSVGILHKGQIVYSRAHGVRSLENSLPMEPETLVGVASNSKAFTCFALAMLVDEGKLNWEDKVKKYIPEFQLHDPYVTQEFTVRDLVTHRSGLTMGAGDLMFFPDGGDFTVQDVIAGLRYLQPESSFRSKFGYNNNLYIVAGEVIRRVSGLTWETFIEQRILQPVGMFNSRASYKRVTDRSNIIDAHAPVNGVVEMLPHDWSELANPAGGIMSNIPDMLTWARFLMNKGKTASGLQLISEKELHTLWQLQTPIPVPANHPYDSKFYGYSHGWFVSDVKGYREISHTGGLLGTVTQFTLIPELELAIVVLTNQQSGSAFRTITNTVKDQFLGIEGRDWLQQSQERWQSFEERTNAQKLAVEKVLRSDRTDPDLPAANIVGVYEDPWFGKVEISADRLTKRFKSLRSPALSGTVQYYKYHTYVVRWDNRSFDADAFMIFDVDEKGVVQGMRMKPISDITDFSFDFVDLNFTKVEAEKAD